MGVPSSRTSSIKPNVASTAKPVGWSNNPEPSGCGLEKRSMSVTRWRARCNSSAAASPAGPQPQTAISLNCATTLFLLLIFPMSGLAFSKPLDGGFHSALACFIRLRFGDPLDVVALVRRTKAFERRLRALIAFDGGGKILGHWQRFAWLSLCARRRFHTLVVQLHRRFHVCGDLLRCGQIFDRSNTTELTHAVAAAVSSTDDQSAFPKAERAVRLERRHAAHD